MVTKPEESKIKHSNIINNIKYEHIELFYITSIRSKNDSSNKIRELIIYSLINKYIPSDWFTLENSDLSSKWYNICDKLNNFVKKLCTDEYDNIKCSKKAGRKYNYDFELHYFLNNNVIKTILLEFKYGAKNKEECPQWASPMRPSQYMSNDFEQFYYNNYLEQICNLYNLPKPLENDYMKEIHMNKPPCLLNIQENYYKGCPSSSKFTHDTTDLDKYNTCKSISKTAIEEFMKNTILIVENLNQYLWKTQNNKAYILFKDGNFYYEYPNKNDYTLIQSSIEIRPPYFIGKTISGKKIKILLRWKNGNGIAFPAFQIS